MSDSSVLALRFGMTRFPDNNTLSIAFDPATLGFSPTYLDQITLEKFPGVRVRGYDQFASQTLGAINPAQVNWKSTSANASYSKMLGIHLFRAGGDIRKMGVDTYIPGDGAGFFDFDKDMTSSNGGTGSTTDGNAFASFLLGYPSTVRTSQISVSTPLNLFTYYYGGYVQDDWRVNSRLSLNYGLRFEHEDGLREEEDRFTVGFDPAMSSALSSVTIPADPLAGMPARQIGGGLMYAGVDGNPTTQGNAPAMKWSPRAGVAYVLTPATVLRGGYGMFWAPFNYPGVSTSASNYGQVGYTAEHDPVAEPHQSGHADQPVSERRDAADRQRPRCADQSRQQHQLRRSEPYRAARAAVLDRCAEGAARQHGVVRRLHGRADRSRRDRRIERYGREHQSARSGIPGAGRGAERPAAESVPRQSERAAVAVGAGDAVPRPAAAAVPAVPAGERPAGDGGLQPLQRRRGRTDAPHARRLGGPFQLHLQRVERQLRRRGELLHRGQPRPAGEQLQLPRVAPGVRRRPAVHDRVLRPVGGIRQQRARRAASGHPGADGRTAVRHRPPLGEQQQGRRPADRRLDRVVGYQPAERLSR